MLTREQILAADDLPRERIEVPEWSGAVWVRTMTGAERDAFEAGVIGTGGRQNLANVRARLVALTLCDESGKRLFGEEDIEALGRKSGAALDRLFAAAQRLNRIGDRDVRDLAGN